MEESEDIRFGAIDIDSILESISQGRATVIETTKKTPVTDKPKGLKRHKTQAQADRRDKSIFLKYKKRTAVKVENLDRLLGLKLPATEETVHVVTSGKVIDALAFVRNIAQYEFIEDLHIVTYSIRKKVISTIAEWFENDELGHATISISDAVKSLNRPCYNCMEEMEKRIPRLFKLKIFHNHAKIALVKTDDNFYVLEGSGNFSANALVEQYQLTNSKELYDFHAGWLDEQQDQYR